MPIINSFTHPIKYLFATNIYVDAMISAGDKKNIKMSFFKKRNPQYSRGKYKL